MTVYYLFSRENHLQRLDKFLVFQHDFQEIDPEADVGIAYSLLAVQARQLFLAVMIYHYDTLLIFKVDPVESGTHSRNKFSFIFNFII